MRRHRTFRVALLAFLLVAMQQAAQWHALDHFGQWLQRPHEHALLLPQQDAPCAVCALFAGGSAAAPSDASTTHAKPEAHAAPDFVASLPTTAAPSSYLIRAPPALL